MSAATVAAARRIYEARNRGDIEAVLAECDEGVVWRPYLATLGGRPIRGHDDVREYLASLAQDWESFQQDTIEFFDAGDQAVVFIDTYAKGRTSGIDLEVPVAHVLSFEGGKCVEFVSYQNRDEAMRAAGLAE